MNNSLFAESVQVCSAIAPVNLATAANTGDWFSLANYRRLVFILHKSAGTAGEDPTITLQQATDNSGTGAKALNVTRYHKKQGAALTAIGQYTAVTMSAGNTITNDTLAEEQAIYIVEIDCADLDVANSFLFVQASIADVGSSSQIGGVLALLLDPRYGGGSLPSALS